SSRCRPSSPSRAETPPAVFHRAGFVNASTRRISRWEGRHARARGLCQVSTSDAKRVIYDARASGELRAERDARTKGWEGSPLRGLLVNDPLAATSRPARHDTRRRQGEAKHDTAEASGGRAHRRDRGGGVRRLHVPAEGD